MKWSKALIPTLKEEPAEAETIAHKLMLRAGLVRKVAAGIYEWLPLGLRALKKIEAIVREEMDRINGQEVLLPAIHPLALWEASGRWDLFGPQMFRLVGQEGQMDYVLGSTHEVIVTDLVGREVKSYRRLPLLLYQIQTKFRNELRPRFGLIRTRELIMMDAYSFHADEKSLQETYERIKQAHCRIFERCGLKFLVVEADSGPFGGANSHEFMVPTPLGEDEVVNCAACGFAANREKAEGTELPGNSSEPEDRMREVSTPGMKTVEEVARFLKVGPDRLVKTLLYRTGQGAVACLVRGDGEVNELKLKRLLGTEDVVLADEKTIEKVSGAPLGFTGPVGLRDVRLLVDLSLKNMKNLVAGANKKDAHLANVNPGRDFPAGEWVDLRTVRENDPCPRCSRPLVILPVTEIDHIFNLGTVYSRTLGATFLDEGGKEKPMIMGCYGIGISRTVAAIIEQNHDEAGIAWPVPVCPYQVLVLALNADSAEVMGAAEEIYRSLEAEGIETLFDDRDERAGVKFKDAELIGIPVRVVVGKKYLTDRVVEIKRRRDGKAVFAAAAEAVAACRKLLEEAGSDRSS